MKVIYGPPTQLVFTTQPGGGTPGAVWAVQPVVAVQDANYNTVAANSDPIILTLTTNPRRHADLRVKSSNASSGVSRFLELPSHWRRQLEFMLQADGEGYDS